MKLLWAKLVAIGAVIVAAAVWITGLLRVRREVETIADEAKREKERVKSLTDAELQAKLEKRVR